jgi:hypothetical protein
VDQETSRIKQHIDSEREKLGSNVDEIKARLRTATDPKVWIDRHLGKTLGVAVAGGFILSRLVRKSPSRRTIREAGIRQSFGSGTSSGEKRSSIGSQFRHVGQTLDRAAAALLGVASRKFEEFVGEAIPGFRDEYDGTERRRRHWAG